jgi:5-methylcytosine-specific restriction endonuclease McrA
MVIDPKTGFYIEEQEVCPSCGSEKVKRIRMQNLRLSANRYCEACLLEWRSGQVANSNIASSMNRELMPLIHEERKIAGILSDLGTKKSIYNIIGKISFLILIMYFLPIPPSIDSSSWFWIGISGFAIGIHSMSRTEKKIELLTKRKDTLPLQKDKALENLLEEYANVEIRNTPVWIYVREYISKQQGSICSRCKQYARLHVHHITPFGQSGSNRIKNLEGICPECHKKEHPWIEIDPEMLRIERQLRQLDKSRKSEKKHHNAP